MADLLDYYDEGFDDSTVEASKGFDGSPLPPGEYVLQVEKNEVVPTKDQTGAILKLTYSVVEGEYENRKVFANFNIRNRSAQAQAIAIGELKALCLATGVDYEHVKRDTGLLEFMPFRAMIGMEKAQEGYAPRNKVTRYLPKGSVGQAPAQQQAASAPPPPRQQAKAGGGGKPLPWSK